MSKHKSVVIEEDTFSEEELEEGVENESSERRPKTIESAEKQQTVEKGLRLDNSTLEAFEFVVRRKPKFKEVADLIGNINPRRQSNLNVKVYRVFRAEYENFFKTLEIFMECFERDLQASGKDINKQ